MQQTSSLRALVVEDDGPIGDLLAQLLPEENIEVVTARSSAEALERASNSRPDALLLDVHVPGGQTEELVHQLRQAYDPALAVVVTSASNEVAFAQRVGATAFVAKPFEVDRLLSIMRRATAAVERSRTIRAASDEAVAKLESALMRDSSAAVLAEHWTASLAQRLACATDLYEAAKITVDFISSQLSAPAASVVVKRAEAFETLAVKGLEDYQVELWRTLPLDSPAPTVEAIRGNHPVFIARPELETTNGPLLSAANELFPTSALALPLRHQGVPFASLGVRLPRGAGPEEHRLVSRLAQVSEPVLARLMA